ncbi:MAG TPA: Rne/Rng family ribonuclease [Geobacteraceae bacterium]
MARKMLINTMHPEEARVAIVEDGRLVELDIEIAGSEQTRGNVYKGTVVRVEPGLQAAFVDIGLKKLGFLQVGELHPSFWQWRDDIPEENRKRRPRIQEVLRRGQELIVQVEKGERDMKGAALTTYMSFPGRYMVLMPGSDSAGVSRKVESEADRKKLKEMAASLEIPEGTGYIIRTEALGKTKTELKKDFQSLVRLHKDILAKAKKTKGPALIYQELDLVIRTIRDYFTAEIDEVLIDNPEVFKQAKDFFKRTMPKFENLVKLHQEKRPIFSKYQLEEQIDQIYEKKVLLKSGGSLVIEPTEALVSIDVNSGKSTGERGVEDTAYKTNLEAAEEVARQLRLRDLGGLIVIDFIDMRDKKHMGEVERTLKNALKLDKARVTVGRISQFGMLEMSRQRIKQTLEQGSVLECPHCGGRGKVKSVENMAISFLRKVHGAAAKGTTAEVRGGLPLEVAYYLLNRKKRELTQIENDYDIEVTVKGKPSFLMNQLELELVKREKPHHVEHAEVVAEALPAPSVAAVPEEVATEGGTAPVAVEESKAKKKRRRGKKGKGEAEPEAAETMAEEPSAAAGEEELVAAGAEAPAQEGVALPEAEEHPEGPRKKKRRRRRRGKGHGAEGMAPEGQLLAVPEEEEGEALPVTPAAESVAGTTGEGDEHAEAVKKKRRRRRRRGKGHGPEAGVVAGAVASEPAQVEVAAVAPQEVPVAAAEVAPVKAKAPRRKKQAESPTQEAVAETPAEVSTPAPKPKRTKKKEAAPVELPASTDVTAQTPPAAKPKRSKKAVSKPKEAPDEAVVPVAEVVAPKKRAPRKKPVKVEE